MRVIEVLAELDRDELDLILGKIGRRLDDLVSPGTPPALTAAQIVHTAMAQGWLTQFLTAVLASRSGNQNRGDLLQAVRESQPARDGDPYEEIVLPSGRLFLDRKGFRQSLHELASSTGARVLMVVGPQGSGKSHSRLLLTHLAEALGTLRAVLLDLDPLVTPDPGTAAHELLFLLNGEPTTLPARETAGSPTRWTNSLAARVEVEIQRAGRPTWLVFDGLDRPGLAGDLLDLVVHLALWADSSSGLLRVVMLGELPVLPPSLEAHTLREVIAPITPADVEACARAVAARHGLEFDPAEIHEAVRRIFDAVPADGPGRNRAIENATRQLVEALRGAAE
jgi:hypothetical protein